MFGFGKKKTHEAPKELLEVRDRLAKMVGTAADVYIATVVGCLTRRAGTTEKDVERGRTRMIAYLQKYVQSEILLERVLNGGRLTPEDFVKLRII